MSLSWVRFLLSRVSQLILVLLLRGNDSTNAAAGVFYVPRALRDQVDVAMEDRLTCGFTVVTAGVRRPMKRLPTPYYSIIRGSNFAKSSRGVTSKYLKSAGQSQPSILKSNE
jgi:hypothetical protein